MLEMRVFDSEVGGEHRGCDFVAVTAVTDEGACVAGAVGRLSCC